MSVLRKFKPLLDRVLVERITAANVSKGGIMIPEKAQQKVNEAVVIAVGPGAKNKDTGAVEPVSVSVGDKVLVPEYGGTKLSLDEKDYVLFRDGDLLGIFEQ